MTPLPDLRLSPAVDYRPPAAALIEIRADDLKLVARALCHSDGMLGAPCTCEARAGHGCPAIDVYGDQARAVLAVLEAMGRLAGQRPVLREEQVREYLALADGATPDDIAAFDAFRARVGQ